MNKLWAMLQLGKGGRAGKAHQVGYGEKSPLSAVSLMAQGNMLLCR
jgi:hypothetical protein